MESELPTDTEKSCSKSDSDCAALAPLKLNPDEYREELAEFDMTKEQQDELLQVLWDIISTFVNIGWGVDTVQMFLPDIFGEVAPDFDADSEKLLESKDALTGKGKEDD